MDRETKAYFEKCIKYSKGDVNEFLQLKCSCAGPLLMVVMNGIDNLGGMCYRFKTGSRIRSIKFMSEKMGTTKSLAEFLYSAVRCGIVHQGMPKIGLRFFLEKYRVKKDDIFYKDSNGWIYLNVIEFAYSYLNAIDKITSDPDKHIKFCPLPKEKEKINFDEALNEISENIGLLDHAIERFQEEQKLDRCEIDYMSSESAYTPDNTMNIEVVEELQPED